MSHTYANARSLRSWYREVVEEEKSSYYKQKVSTPHDEAFKKLLQTFLLSLYSCSSRN